MELNLEKFTRVGGSFAPFVSLRRGGSIGLSQGALQRYNLTDGDWYMVLYFDKAARIIGIQPTRNPGDDGAIKLIKRSSVATDGKESSSSSISARAFFNYYDIPMNESNSYKTTWDDEKKMILVNLGEPFRKNENKPDI